MDRTTIAVADLVAAATRHAVAANGGSKSAERLLIDCAARAKARQEHEPDNPHRRSVSMIFREVIGLRMRALEAVDAGTGGSHAGDAFARRFERALKRERDALARLAARAAEVSDPSA